MYRTVPSGAERIAAASARLLLVSTVLLALTGQAALILHVPLPAWEHAAVLLDSISVGFCALARSLFPPRRVQRHGGR